MPLTTLDKGKGKHIPDVDENPSDSVESSSSSSLESDSSSDLESESEDEVTPEYLESLLEKARLSATSGDDPRKSIDVIHEEDVVKLSGSKKEWVDRHSVIIKSYLAVQAITFPRPRKSTFVLF